MERTLTMSYQAPWRNRRQNLYIQYCYVDELATCDPKLLRGMELFGSMFDDDWSYAMPPPRKRTRRPIALRFPVWWGRAEQKLVEKGDDFDRDVRQKEL